MNLFAVLGLLIIIAIFTPWLFGLLVILTPLFYTIYLEKKEQRLEAEAAAEALRRQQQAALELAREERLRKSQEQARELELARQQERARLREPDLQQELARQKEMARQTEIWLQNQESERQLAEKRRQIATRCAGVCSSCQRDVCVQQQLWEDSKGI